ncbi:MAG: hypothetical protein RIS28_1607, partial [Bacteroidota bacterium]
MKHIKFSLVLSTCLGVMGLQAQKSSTKANAAGASMNPSKSVVADSLVKPILGQVNFRMIGPATTSGRIVDIAVNPLNKAEYYIAAAYGGVWKTTNGGTTYQPIFDGYGT